MMFSFNSQVQDIAFLGNTPAKHDIEFSFLKRRRNLILHYLYPDTVSCDLSALL